MCELKKVANVEVALKLNATYKTITVLVIRRKTKTQKSKFEEREGGWQRDRVNTAGTCWAPETGDMSTRDVKQDILQETGDITSDRRQETGDVRQETWVRRCETGDMRQEMWDKRRETGGVRQETLYKWIWYKRQEQFCPAINHKFFWHTTLQ